VHSDTALVFAAAEDGLLRQRLLLVLLYISVCKHCRSLRMFQGGGGKVHEEACMQCYSCSSMGAGVLAVQDGQFGKRQACVIRKEGITLV